MIPLFKVLMSEDAGRHVAETLATGYIGQGPQVDRFEDLFGLYVEAPRPVLTTASCTAALDLALHLVGLEPGDEVITTAQTCTATNSPIVTRWGIPVWADVDPATGLIDPESVARLVTPKTRAIMAVDWAGRPCDYLALRRHGIPVIQDAAHRGPTPLGEHHGDYVAWSFQAIKYLTCGDGGALLCPDDETTDRARLLRWYGLDRRGKADFRCEQNIQEVGYKAHMNDVAATIGLANLPAARAAVKRQRARVFRYADAFAGLPGVTMPDPDPAGDYWLATILVDDRDAFQVHMTERGIATSPVHTRNDRHTAFKRANRRASVWLEQAPGLDIFDARQVAIPVGWWMSDDDEAAVIAAVTEWAHRARSEAA